MTTIKTVWITGASSGLGLATAKAFAGRGWLVVAGARSFADGTVHEEEKAEHWVRLRLDVTDGESCAHFVRRALEISPRVDALVCGAAVLVLGFGPVGRALAVRLAALGARVTVAARRPVQRAMAEELGLRAVPLTELAAEAAAFDTVVNTIPAPVLTAQVLAALPKKSLIVDLASKPGGTDFAAARRLGHTALHALSLPTVWAPETAGEALARTVQAILQEREGTV